MRIHYTCDHCGEAIDTIEVSVVDEARFGFDCLTDEERQEIIRFDPDGRTMHIQSLCDNCIAVLGLAAEIPPGLPAPSFLH